MFWCVSTFFRNLFPFPLNSSRQGAGDSLGRHATRGVCSWGSREASSGASPTVGFMPLRGKCGRDKLDANKSTVGLAIQTMPVPFSPSPSRYTSRVPFSGCALVHRTPCCPLPNRPVVGRGRAIGRAGNLHSVCPMFLEIRISYTIDPIDQGNRGSVSLLADLQPLFFATKGPLNECCHW